MNNKESKPHNEILDKSMPKIKLKSKKLREWLESSPAKSDEGLEDKIADVLSEDYCKKVINSPLLDFEHVCEGDCVYCRLKEIMRLFAGKDELSKVDGQIILTEQQLKDNFCYKAGYEAAQKEIAERIATNPRKHVKELRETAEQNGMQKVVEWIDSKPIFIGSVDASLRDIYRPLIGNPAYRKFLQDNLKGKE